MPTPQRLPIVNSDDGVWGDILRQYLLKEHYDDGTDNAVNGGHKTITIRAGTSGAGTAPLKFTSGTLMTTPEAGAVEFNSDTLYFTQTTSTTRKKIAAYDDTSGATGDIYYRDSSGYFKRLGIGSTNDVLTVSGGLPVWQAPSGSAMPVADTTAIVKNNADNTKQVKLDASGITTGTTRTLTVPNANTTIVGTDTIQTLTNKTISGASNTLSNIGLASLSATGTASSSTFLRGDNTWAAGSSITPSWVFNVDNYGADPTGSADSSTAVNNAISALGTNPGIIEFGTGTYKLNSGVVLAYPGQYFRGQGIGSTTIDSRVNGVTMRVWDSTVATSGINAPGMGGGLLGGMTISGVNNTNAGAIGFQLGDLVGPQIERLKIVSFTTTNAIGFNGMNRYSWTEYGNFDVRADYNTNCIVLESHASHPLYYGGKSSWSYNNMNMSFNVAANQNGVIMRNKISAIGVFWHMNFNAAAATTNTGVMITIGDNGTADCHLEGNLWWEGELTDAGTTGHKDINVGANSALIGSGSIIFHDYAANFVAGTATAYRVVFAGKVNCPSLGHYIDSVSNNTPFVTIGDSGARFNAKGDAANYINITEGASGGWPMIDVAGPSTNAGLVIRGKGTGRVEIGPSDEFHVEPGAPTGALTLNSWGVDFATGQNIYMNSNRIQDVGSPTSYNDAATAGYVQDSTITMTNKTLTAPRVDYIKDTSGNTSLEIQATGSANWIAVQNKNTGSDPSFVATGSDTNIGLNFVPKGTGVFTVYESAGQTTATVYGSGSATNVNLNLTTKGTGTVKANGNPVISSVTAIPAVTGTPSSGTYLRGDGTWAAPSGSGDMVAATYDPAGIAQQVVGTSATQTLTNKTLTNPKINGAFDVTNGLLAMYFSTAAGAVNYLQANGNVTGSGPQLMALGSDTNVDLLLQTKGTGVAKVNGDTIITSSSLTSNLASKADINVIAGNPLLVANTGSGNGAAINTHPETDNYYHLPHMVNDIAYNNMRGGSVIWKKNGSVVTPSNGDNPFTPDVNFADGFSISSPSTDTITAEVTLCRTFNWGTKWGIVMTDWAAAKNVTIEVWDNVAGSWATAYTATNDTNGFHWAGYSAASGHAMTKVRYTLSNFRSSDVRITQMFVVGYDSTLLSGPFMNRNGGAIYGSNASPVTFTATGGDSNIGINLVSKGSGTVQANGVQIADLSSSQTFTNKTLTTPKITTIKDTNGNTVLDLPGQPSAVNNIYFGNHSSGNSPVFGVAGSDTDISLSLQTKGTGVLYVLRSNGHSTVQAGGGYNSGNVNLEFNSQGTGVVRANGVQVADLSSTQTLTNKTIDGASNTITNIPASAIPGDINGRVLAQSAGIINF